MSKLKQKKIYPLSDHYDGKRFFNPGLAISKGFKEVFKMLTQMKARNKWPKFVKNNAKPDFERALVRNQVAITYINHSCHLIQLKNLNILTDPIFSKRAGPFSLLGPKRVRDPGIGLSELPFIDVVLISHNHYDHMDLPSLSKLAKMFKPLFIIPLGNRRYFKNINSAAVQELDWWETVKINKTDSITAVPAQHWSRRQINDTNKALWAGFWIHSEKMKIFFAGDTGYGPHFKSIQKTLGAPDISILPIGSYEPRWFMQPQHMNPEEAVIASQDLKSQLNIATHHRTFRLSFEGIDEPVIELKNSMALYGMKDDEFVAPENGETIRYSK